MMKDNFRADFVMFFTESAFCILAFLFKNSELTMLDLRVIMWI